MEDMQVFTSTGVKLLHQHEVVKKFKQYHLATPISLQIAPTSRCNLRCVFCSNVNRKQHEDIDLVMLSDYLANMKMLGAKTVEWTGGGDPTLYPEIDFAMRLADELGYKQGVISNGLRVRELRYLQRVAWLRISMNALDYVEQLDIPDIEGVLGFSYVMNEKTDFTTLDRLFAHVKRYHPRYVRIVPNCQATIEEQERNNIQFAKLVGGWGEPFFYQAKTFSSPKRCWWGYFKPFLLHDGWVYPCSSVVLHEEADRSFHTKYRWYHGKYALEHYQATVTPFDPRSCSHCVFRQQNDMVDSLIYLSGQEDFI